MLCPMRNPWEDTKKPNAAQLFEQAMELFAIGHTRGAGCLARQTIDAALVEACHKAGIWPRHPVTGAEIPKSRLANRTERYMLTLRMADVVSEELVKRIRGALTIAGARRFAYFSGHMRFRVVA
jgi:hypothetical protein